MGKYLIFAAGLTVAGSAYAWGTGGMSDYVNAQSQLAQTQLMQAQTQAQQAYNECIRSNNPSACGVPPQVNYAPAPATAPVYRPPVQCHQVCQQQGQYQYCDTRCN